MQTSSRLPLSICSVMHDRQVSFSRPICAGHGHLGCRPQCGPKAVLPVDVLTCATSESRLHSTCAGYPTYWTSVSMQTWSYYPHQWVVLCMIPSRFGTQPVQDTYVLDAGLNADLESPSVDVMIHSPFLSLCCAQPVQDTYILDAGLNADLELPFTCRGGICG